MPHRPGAFEHFHRDRVPQRHAEHIAEDLRQDHAGRGHAKGLPVAIDDQLETWFRRHTGE